MNAISFADDQREPLTLAELCQNVRGQDPAFTPAERVVLAHISDFAHISVQSANRDALSRLIEPIEHVVTAAWAPAKTTAARNILLGEMHRRGTAYWSWDEDVWIGLASAAVRNWSTSARNSCTLWSRTTGPTAPRAGKGCSRSPACWRTRGSSRRR